MHHKHISVFHMFCGAEPQKQLEDQIVYDYHWSPPPIIKLTTKRSHCTAVISCGTVTLKGFLFSTLKQNRNRKINVQSYGFAATILVWLMCTYDKRFLYTLS